MTKVSVVLPVYNGEQYLAQSIESVIGQTFKDWELIIVNDCSTDKSLSIAKKYAKKDKRIKIITNKVNQKLPKSLNIGFENSCGEYRTWTSDDNWYHKYAFEKMVKYLDEKASDVMVCCDYEAIYDKESGKVYTIKKLDISRLNMLFWCPCGACFMYRTTTAEKIGGYDENNFLVEDYEYWLRIMLEGNIGRIDEVLYFYRHHKNNLTTTRKQEIYEKDKELKDKYRPVYYEKWSELEKQVEEILAFGEPMCENIKYPQLDQSQYLSHYLKAKKWIEEYTINRSGIAVNSVESRIIYPEVTGYYIPTLLRWGFREKALQFANHLLSIQNKDGSWNDPSGKMPYTFDTGQILKGLIALIENGLDGKNKYKKAAIKGADWILSQQRKDGSIATPDYSQWSLPYGKSVPEAIHIYCLKPLRDLANMYGIKKYEKCVERALEFYLNQDDLVDFNTLAHFHAYIIEGLIDIGKPELAAIGLKKIEDLQKENGFVPAYQHVDFSCSTAMFQYAICWFKLGLIIQGLKTFDYAINLQNESGGWFGSYGDGANYMPDAEISWANKYFLDAIYYKSALEYERINWAEMWDDIDTKDERYQVLEKEIQPKQYQKILDLGCGKGRYTRNLIKKYPQKKFYGVDLSKRVLASCPEKMEKKQGTILNIPYSDKEFDVVFLTESLEHCVDLNNALAEIKRVLKPNGKIIVIDKDEACLGRLPLAPFEMWFGKDRFKAKLEKQYGFKTRVVDVKELELDEHLFCVWIGELA